MQCAACLEVYPDVFDACPQCQEAEPDAAPATDPEDQRTAGPHGREAAPSSAMIENSNMTTQTTQSANNSTLIEFPGVNRNRPAWRKELSERFREIQQRRTREAELEAEAELRQRAELSAEDGREEFDAATSTTESEAIKQLGLVPAPDEPEMNPIVANALRRVERARRQAAPAPRAGSSRGHAATAAARVVEEQPEEDAEKPPAPALVKREAEEPATEKACKAERAERVERPLKTEKVEKPVAGEPARAPGLLVVQPMPAAELQSPPAVASAITESAPPPPVRPKAEPPQVAPAPQAAPRATPVAFAPEAAADVSESTTKPQPRKVSGVIDDNWLERREAEILPKVAGAEAAYDDRAPRLKRVEAAAVDLLILAFLCAPCAAVIELTIGDWSEPRVLASMGGIVALMLFLYHTCAVALASRTLGMKLFALHVVDADTGSVPTTGQCVRRAFVYLLSLATFGLGILYALLNAEGRTAHDLLSGTVVVKE